MKLDFTNRMNYWTAVDVANQFGLDKKPFNERVEWVSENYNNLIDFANDADSKGEYLKGINALYNIEQGNFPQHMVYLDASNQALQLYAVLTGDLKTASTCNIANGNNMADAYQLLANALNNSLGVSCFTRSDCKKALMTTMYGKLGAWFRVLQDKYPRSDNPIRTFCSEYGFTITIDEETGEETFPEMERAFNDALLTIAPKAISAMEAIQSLNDENIGTYRWVMPDGFKVKYDVRTEINIEASCVSRSGKILNLSVVKEVYVPSEFNRGMAPNVIHSVDGYVAREMIRRMNGKFITTIHDAFACHPSDADLMRKNYEDIMVELLHSDLLNDILTQIKGTPIYISKDNGLTEEHIRTSLYYLG